MPLVLYTAVEGVGRLTGIAPKIDVLSTILSVILFAAVFPLWSAVETLSESKIRERKLKEHAEKVGKIIRETEELD